MNLHIILELICKAEHIQGNIPHVLLILHIFVRLIHLSELELTIFTILLCIILNISYIG
jgi:hypothetical protein